MHRYIPALANRAAPRYTSYPTAAEFDGSVGAGQHAAALGSAAKDGPASLYIHIPYCHSVCWYCGCNTGALNREDRLEAYLEALFAEIAQIGAAFGGTIGQVHFGGGTPNVLSPAQFSRLAEHLRQNFAIPLDAEWAVEIDPRSFTRDHAIAFAAAGVGRISIGAQTFSPHIQAAIGRIQPLAEVSRVMADAREAGIARINLDLMYGLPGQRLDDIAATLSATQTLAPDRVAMFGYAHMPRLLPRQRMIDESRLPDGEARFWQRALAHDMLVEQGMEAIGFDHFARPWDNLTLAAREGALHRNFQGFTDDCATTLIGLGASAISQFPGLIVQNEKHVGRYRMLAGNRQGCAVRGLVRSREDRLRGAVIERLLCDGVVDAQAIARAHGLPASAAVADEALLYELEGHGVVRRDGARLAITRDGLPYARLAAAVFDTYRNPGARRFSRAV
ncbi:oxygen-independent coproporphyrinogen III oxidase [Stakelama sp. CBK3Z-3]|uniref:Coproporphyrinogen-III oxidase n=1 Tax=Stakelama flava TaxID=2860338 RepID=A0ABS6XMZ0_9SPHN|nr:oxygen-independent coproporphyrinogen III oxidase [Stakelama flava]MBW4331562.1 oxygen-independent coproporphyrinogen III oxidase [Stakelama flava]